VWPSVRGRLSQDSHRVPSLHGHPLVCCPRLIAFAMHTFFRTTTSPATSTTNINEHQQHVPINEHQHQRVPDHQRVLTTNELSHHKTTSVFLLQSCPSTSATFPQSSPSVAGDAGRTQPSVYDTFRFVATYGRHKHLQHRPSSRRLTATCSSGMFLPQSCSNSNLAIASTSNLEDISFSRIST